MSRQPGWFLDQIDNKFRWARARKLSRLDPQWGAWSGALNREVRRVTTEIEGAGDLDAAARYKLVFVYWLTCSRMLETLYRGRGVFGRSRLARDKKALDNLRAKILSPNPIEVEIVDTSPVAEMMFGKMVAWVKKHKPKFRSKP
jgi:hypothetical protein